MHIRRAIVVVVLCGLWDSLEELGHTQIARECGEMGTSVKSIVVAVAVLVERCDMLCSLAIFQIESRT